MGTSSKSEVMQLVRQALIRDAATSALVADRVFAASPRSADVSGMVYPFLIVEVVPGGFLRYSGALQTLAFDLYGYSTNSQDEADRVYKAACDILQACHIYDTTTVAAGGKAIAAQGYTRETARPTGGWNATVQAWYCMGRWMATTAG